jgi:hemoglobin
MSDLESIDDVKKVVNSFYSAVLDEPVLKDIFQMTEEEWAHHLPRMYNFWENWLWQTGSYTGGMMQVHIHVNKKHKLESIHFEHWVALFQATVSSLYFGPNANLMKQKAYEIGEIMLAKLNHINTQHNHG